MFKHILVPTDGSELSQRALAAAVALAKRTNASLTAVHVMPVFTTAVYPEGIMYGIITEEDFNAETEREADLALAVATTEAQRGGVSCQTERIRRAHAYEGVLSVAADKGCDLIVMASHGRRGIRAVLLGSETQKVLTHSKIPVLVYR